MIKLISLILILAQLSHGASSLTNGANTTDRISHGSATSLDDLNPFSYAIWVRCTTRTSARPMMSKATRRFRLNGTAGNVELFVDRATTDTSYITNDAPLPTNTWKYMTATYTNNTTPTSHIYTALQGRPLTESTYGTAQDGTGNIASDAASNFETGNLAATNVAFQGQIGLAMVWNSILTQDELQDNMMNPHNNFSGSRRIFSIYGLTSTNVQIDVSAFNNNGDVTGSVESVLGPPISFPGGVM